MKGKTRLVDRKVVQKASILHLGYFEDLTPAECFENVRGFTLSREIKMVALAAIPLKDAGDNDFFVILTKSNWKKVRAFARKNGKNGLKGIEVHCVPESHFTSD